MYSAPATKPAPLPTPDDRARCDRKPGLGRDEQQQVPDDDGAHREEPDVARADPVRRAPARDLDEQVRHEERRREEADDGERDAVGVGERVGDGADVRDVPRHAGAERERPCDREPLARASYVRSRAAP